VPAEIAWAIGQQVAQHLIRGERWFPIDRDCAAIAGEEGTHGQSLSKDNAHSSPGDLVRTEMYSLFEKRGNAPS